jgi:L-2-hydroxyglutarate oxidase LhgO
VTERVDAVVIGAGVVGLACARALALAGHDVIVLERHGQIGVETSSRNSEVIHAGIYYPTGSAKAALCVRGKALLYDYCTTHPVEHRRCGKIIVATQDDQIDTLKGYQRAARANGAGELRWLTAAEIGDLEPAVRCIGGVFSETTGIIDSHSYMQSLQSDLEAARGMIAFESVVREGQVGTRGTRLVTDDTELDATLVVNAAGLHAPMLARQLHHAPLNPFPRAYYAKGHYYAYAGKSPFGRLIYPVAETGGLGVHVTLDLAGQARFGPDVMWQDRVDYSFDDHNRHRFVAAIRRYFPALDPERLHPAYTGVRPKISGPTEPAADFAILGPREHGARGIVHLLGIESPGLTASLAIAERVIAALRDGG